MTAESKVRYDANADVLYLVCDGGEIARSIEVSPGITVELGDAGNILASRSFGPPRSSRRRASPRSMPNGPECGKGLPSTRSCVPTAMAPRRGDPGAHLQRRIPGLIIQIEALRLIGLCGIQPVRSSST
jgi:hypothetical protein